MPRPLSPRERTLISQVRSTATIELATLERTRATLREAGLADEAAALLVRIRDVEETLQDLQREAGEVLDSGEI